MTEEIKHEMKVYVTLDDGKSFFGKMYLKDGERVQDLLNDDREFIPILKHHMVRSKKYEQYAMTVVNKRVIRIIEEIV